jgi:hypothetical protein
LANPNDEVVRDTAKAMKAVAASAAVACYLAPADPTGDCAQEEGADDDDDHHDGVDHRQYLLATSWGNTDHLAIAVLTCTGGGATRPATPLGRGERAR